MPGCLIFKTTGDGSGTPTERVRISKTGNTMLGQSHSDVSYGHGAEFSTQWGTTDGDNKFLSMKSTGYAAIRLRGETSTNTEFTHGVGCGSYYMAYDEIGSAHRLTVLASTGVVSGNLNNTSDEKLKENITSLADGQTLTLGKTGRTQMVFTPHSTTAANEKNINRFITRYE